jgi:two-component system NtrC family sensor kinase
MTQDNPRFPRQDTPDPIEAEKEALRNAHIFLDSIVENIPNMIFVKDARKLRFVRINRAGEELLGLSRDELIGRSDHDIFPNDEADFFTSKDREVLEGKILVDIPQEPVHTRKSGLRILHTKKIPILDERGEPRFLLGISEDITQRKKIEDDLRLQSQIVRNMAEGVVLTRIRDGIIVYANPTFARTFGYEEGELTGMHVSVLNAGGEVSGEEIAARIHEHLDRHGEWSGEIRNQRKDGTEFWSRARISGLEHPAYGAVWLSVQEDITERKEAEGRVRRAERLASLGTLAAGIAHEINNPIGAILLHAQNALLYEKSSEGKETNLQEIVDQAERCGRIVKGVLQAAKQESRDRWLGDINVNVLRAKYLVQQEALDRGSTIDLRLNDLPEIQVNPTEIEQVVVNLLQNAIQSRDRGVHVVARTEATPRTVRLIVEDDGPGVPLEAREYIFDPFHTTRLQKGGSGLGLSIVHGIVDSHGGTIGVESPEGGGTRIVIDLPRSAGAR